MAARERKSSVLTVCVLFAPIQPRANRCDDCEIGKYINVRGASRPRVRADRRCIRQHGARVEQTACLFCDLGKFGIDVGVSICLECAVRAASRCRTCLA
jgi:hypothetical protein